MLGPTFVRFDNAEAGDHMTVDGRGGDDILSASIATMKLTLAGGDGDNVLIGGPGDDVSGGKGDDSAWLGGDFDRFSWKPGDGSDRVDGGASRDSLSFQGTNDPEAFDLRVAMDLDRVEEINAIAGGGADTFAVGDTPPHRRATGSTSASLRSPSRPSVTARPIA